MQRRRPMPEAPEAAPSVGRLVVKTTMRPSSIAFEYSTDCGDHGSISVAYPYDLTPDDETMLPAMASGVGLYLGQLCLAREIELNTPLDASMLPILDALAGMLYDVRCWKDGVPYRPRPVFIGRPGSVEAVDFAGSEMRSHLLWSGGKDSTLAALTLHANGFDVAATHVTANCGVESRERRAVSRLAARLGVPLQTLGFTHDEFLSFSSRYAVEWNRPPRCNRVPFGRDLILPLIALPFVRRSGASVLSMGHDNECRNAFVDVDERRFPRNDVESSEGALLLEQFLGTYALRDLALLPPLAGFTELEILRQMLVDHPDEMAATSFCFWPGDNCGRCAKCLRYYLAQRVYSERDILTFEINPLTRGASPELDDLLEQWGRPGLLFQKEVVYCLARLIERNDIRPGEDRLRDFGASALFSDALPHLGGWEKELHAPQEDPQLRGRVWASAPPLSLA